MRQERPSVCTYKTPAAAKDREIEQNRLKASV